MKEYRVNLSAMFSDAVKCAGDKKLAEIVALQIHTIAIAERVERLNELLERLVAK